MTFFSLFFFVKLTVLVSHFPTLYTIIQMNMNMWEILSLQYLNIERLEIFLNIISIAILHQYFQKPVLLRSHLLLRSIFKLSIASLIRERTFVTHQSSINWVYVFRSLVLYPISFPRAIKARSFACKYGIMV